MVELELNDILSLPDTDGIQGRWEMQIQKRSASMRKRMSDWTAVSLLSSSRELIDTQGGMMPAHLLVMYALRRFRKNSQGASKPLLLLTAHRMSSHADGDNKILFGGGSERGCFRAHDIGMPPIAGAKMNLEALDVSRIVRWQHALDMDLAIEQHLSGTEAGELPSDWWMRGDPVDRAVHVRHVAWPHVLAALPSDWLPTVGDNPAVAQLATFMLREGVMPTAPGGKCEPLSFLTSEGCVIHSVVFSDDVFEDGTMVSGWWVGLRLLSDDSPDQGPTTVMTIPYQAILEPTVVPGATFAKGARIATMPPLRCSSLREIEETLGTRVADWFIENCVLAMDQVKEVEVDGRMQLRRLRRIDYLTDADAMPQFIPEPRMFGAPLVMDYRHLLTKVLLRSEEEVFDRKLNKRALVKTEKIVFLPVIQLLKNAPIKVLQDQAPNTSFDLFRIRENWEFALLGRKRPQFQGRAHENREAGDTQESE